MKSDDKWKGWNPEISAYFETPILFEGNLNFSINLEPLIVSDKESGSINFIWKIRKFIERGGSMMLSEKNWISLFLTLAKNHMPNDFQSLAKVAS